MSSANKNLHPKVLIIGGGLTGSVTARLINDETFADIEVWEKLQYTGGRFYTYRNPENSQCAFDTGAQYVSVTLEFFRTHAKLYNELLDNDLLVPLTQKVKNFRKLSDTKLNFITPDGMDSLVTHFLEKSDSKVELEHEVESIHLNESSDMWDVIARNGVKKQFHIVILTIPAPEVLKIQGNFLNLSEDDDVKLYLEQVSYWPRLSIGFMYKEPQKFFNDFPTPMKYFPKHDVLNIVSVDNRKRGKGNDCPVLFVQTTKKFSAEYMEKSADEIEKKVTESLESALLGVPKPSAVLMTKWPYAQVRDPYLDSPGCVVLNKQPMLLCGGDSFTETHFNGCVSSAMRIVEELLKTVTFSKHQRKKSSTV